MRSAARTRSVPGSSSKDATQGPDGQLLQSYKASGDRWRLYGGELVNHVSIVASMSGKVRQFTGRAGNSVPGLTICLVAASAAAWLSEQYGAPLNLIGLLIGLALNFVATDARTHPGLEVASRSCLRFGIVLLGTQVTLAQLGTLGAGPILALLVVMAIAVGAAVAASRALGQSVAVGLLAGGSTAICGASAALALYSAIGRERLSEAQFALTLVGISTASALAMSLYPALAASLDLSDRQAGFLIGASVHDVAQAIGGGYAFSDAAGSYATVVKLARVALLAPVVMLVSLAYSANAAEDADQSLLRRVRSRLTLPWFIAAFLGVVLINSLFVMPAAVATVGLAAAKGLLLLAVIATAVRSRFDLLMSIGWRATLPVVAATLASLVVSLGFAGWLL